MSTLPSLAAQAQKHGKEWLDRILAGTPCSSAELFADHPLFAGKAVLSGSPDIVRRELISTFSRFRELRGLLFGSPMPTTWVKLMANYAANSILLMSNLAIDKICSVLVDETLSDRQAVSAFISALCVEFEARYAVRQKSSPGGVFRSLVERTDGKGGRVLGDSELANAREAMFVLFLRPLMCNFSMPDLEGNMQKQQDARLNVTARLAQPALAAYSVDMVGNSSDPFTLDANFPGLAVFLAAESFTIAAFSFFLVKRYISAIDATKLGTKIAEKKSINTRLFVAEKQIKDAKSLSPEQIAEIAATSEEEVFYDMYSESGAGVFQGNIEDDGGEPRVTNAANIVTRVPTAVPSTFTKSAVCVRPDSHESWDEYQRLYYKGGKFLNPPRVYQNGHLVDFTVRDIKSPMIPRGSLVISTFGASIYSGINGAGIRSENKTTTLVEEMPRVESGSSKFEIDPSVYKPRNFNQSHVEMPARVPKRPAEHMHMDALPENNEQVETQKNKIS